MIGLILANSTLYLNDSIKQQIKHVNKLLKTKFTVSGKDSIMSVFGAAMDELSQRKLSYKMLSDKRSVVEKLDGIDNSFRRTREFSEIVWDLKEYANDFTRDTRNIDVPVLIITGKKDYAIGVDHYKLFQFPEQRVVKIAGGHMLYFEQNKAFTDAIFSFVNDRHK